MTTKFKKGDRVKVAREDHETDWTFGLTGTVISATKPKYGLDNLTVLVEFSKEDAKGFGHSDEGDGACRLDGANNRWWVDPKVLDRVEDTLTLGTPEVPGVFKAGSKTAAIFSHLYAGKKITTVEAQTVYGNYRLSSSIADIRAAGYEVETEEKKDEAGRKYSSYRLLSKSPGLFAAPALRVKAA